MRILAGCHQCTFDAGEIAPAADYHWIDIGELTDDGIASGKCPNGHEINAVVQAARHVLLFDSACLALIDGYFREAIGTFAASMERFHEFAIRVLWRHHDMGDDAVDAAWSPLAKRSEAQTGAFVALLAAHTRRVATSVKDYQKRRNAVIHGGALPTADEALEFGSDCYDHIMDVTDELRRSAAEALDRENTMQLIKRSLRLGTVASRSTLASGTSPVALDVLRDPRPSFVEALELLDRWPVWVHPGDRIRVRSLANAAGASVGEFLAALSRPAVSEAIMSAIRSGREPGQKAE